MARYYMRISAAQQSEVEAIEQLASEATSKLGGHLTVNLPDPKTTKNILDTGLSPEFFIGLPAGIVVGMIANEIHRRLINWSGRKEEVAVTKRGTDTVITDARTGLQIILRPLDEDETLDDAKAAGDKDE